MPSVHATGLKQVQKMHRRPDNRAKQLLNMHIIITEVLC